MTDLPPAPEKIRVRQIALCTPDIRPVERQVEQALDITASQRDKPGPPIWMYNGVFPVGNSFLEILQPERPEAPTTKFLEKQGGAAGYMLLLQVDDIEKARARVEALNIRIAWDMGISVRHGVKAGALHLHPSDTRGPLTSLDWMEDWDDWAWAGNSWQWHRRTDVVSGIAAAQISSADPDGVAARFAEMLGRDLEDDRSITLEETSVRFVEGPAGSRDLLTGIDMTATDRSRVGETFEFARTVVKLV
jgi:hypothetical protein